MCALFGLLMLTMQGCHWQSDKPITIAAHVWVGYETLFLARSENLLDKKLVNLTETTSPTDSLQALLDGRVDGAALTLDEVLRGRSMGLPLTVLMVFDISAGADALIARSSIKQLADLKGRRIGYEPGTLGALMLTEMLRTAGLKKEDVKLVELTIDKQVDAWTHDRVDALVSYEPVMGQLMAKDAHKLFDSRQIPDTIVDVLAIRSDVLDVAHATAIRQLISAHFAELDHINHNPHDASYRMAAHLNLPETEVMSSFKGLLQPEIVNNRRLLTGNPPPILAAARRISSLMVEEKLLPHDENLEMLIRADFLSEVTH